MLPWLLPEFVSTEQCSEMVKTDILNLSKDSDTFLKDIEGSEDAKYSPSNNIELINLLRSQDPRLKQARFLFVQRDAKIDVTEDGDSYPRTITSGNIISSTCTRSLTTTVHSLPRNIRMRRSSRQKQNSSLSQSNRKRLFPLPKW